MLAKSISRLFAAVLGWVSALGYVILRSYFSDWDNPALQDFNGGALAIGGLNALIVAPLCLCFGLLWLHKPGRVPFTSVEKGDSIPEGLIGLFMLLGLVFIAWASIAEHGFTVYKNHPFASIWIIFASWVFPFGALRMPGWLVMSMGSMGEHPFLRRLVFFGRGGSSRWAGLRTLAKFEAKTTITQKGDRWMTFCKGIYLGRSMILDDELPRHIAVRDDAHMLTVAQTGSGKSITAIWPNLAMYQASAVVLDPKGEHANVCGPARDACGGVWVLDPFGECNRYESTPCNPLDAIDLANEPDAVRGMLAAISSGCIMQEGSNSLHWTETARLLLEGLIAHVLSEEPPERRTLPYIFDLVQGIDPATGMVNVGAFDETLIEMAANGVAGGIAQQAAAALANMGDRERGSVMSTLQRSIKWVSDPAMRRQLAPGGADGFNFKKMTDPMDIGTLFIVLPTRYMDEYSRWLRVLVNAGIRVLEAHGGEDRRAANRPVLFVLDEFPKLGGNLSAIEDGIVTLRGAGVKLWPLIQNIGQLKRDYKDNWQTFISSSTVQAFGVGDDETARWLSELLGDTRVAHSGRKARSVMRETKSVTTEQLYTSRQIMDDLGKTARRQIVVPNEGLPMRLERLAFEPLTVEGGGSFRGLALKKSFAEPAPKKPLPSVRERKKPKNIRPVVWLSYRQEYERKLATLDGHAAKLEQLRQWLNDAINDDVLWEQESQAQAVASHLQDMRKENPNDPAVNDLLEKASDVKREAMLTQSGY